MTIRSLATVMALCLLALPLPAQTADDVKGTWSGDWVFESGPRDRVTVEFRLEEGALIGKLVNPRQLDFRSVTFEESSGLVVAEAIDPEDSVKFRIEARIEGTRMNGSMSGGSRSGDLKLTKWTYVPRPR